MCVCLTHAHIPTLLLESPFSYRCKADLSVNKSHLDKGQFLTTVLNIRQDTNLSDIESPLIAFCSLCFSQIAVTVTMNSFSFMLVGERGVMKANQGRKDK